MRAGGPCASSWRRRCRARGRLSPPPPPLPAARRLSTRKVPEKEKGVGLWWPGGRGGAARPEARRGEARSGLGVGRAAGARARLPALQPQPPRGCRMWRGGGACGRGGAPTPPRSRKQGWAPGGRGSGPATTLGPAAEVSVSDSRRLYIVSAGRKRGPYLGTARADRSLHTLRARRPGVAGQFFYSSAGLLSRAPPLRVRVVGGSRQRPPARPLLKHQPAIVVTA